MRRLPPSQLNFTVHRERDAGALSRLALLLVSGLVLTGGFVFAAGQHFAAVRYGYRSEELRRERDRLLEEYRHLLAARERAAAPARLEGAARRIGMQPVQPGQMGTAKSGAGALPRPAPALINPSAPLKR